MRENLVTWEKDNGYKGKWVAEKLGVSPSTYSKIKSGKLDPNIELAYKFKDVFPDVDVLKLMEKQK